MSFEAWTSFAENSSDDSSNTEQTLSGYQEGDSDEDKGKESSPDEVRPEKKRKLSSRALVKNYLIDLMASSTIIDELNMLRKFYNILDDVKRIHQAAS